MFAQLFYGMSKTIEEHKGWKTLTLNTPYRLKIFFFKEKEPSFFSNDRVRDFLSGH